MKRVLGAVGCGVVIAAVASIVLAQMASEGTVVVPGSEPQRVTVVEEGERRYLAADEVMTALGGRVSADPRGFTIELDQARAAVGSNSPVAVFRDQLIQMPYPPLVIEGRPFLAPQFFDAFLRAAAGRSATWDPAAGSLVIRPVTVRAVAAQTSVVEVEGMTKIVIQLSERVDYSVVREPSRYLVRFRGEVRPETPQQNFGGPHVSRISFRNNEAEITLTSPDIAGDFYALENPFRVVVDLRRGAAPDQERTLPPPLTLRPSELPGVRTIVIDPGHGGKESGAAGPTGLLEKDVALAISRKLARLLASRTGARVFLTRDDDSVVTLDQRTAIANRYKADLFLSIHMNAARTRGAHGSETFFLSLDASDDLAAEVAMRENAVDEAASAESVSADSDLRLILWDLAQQQYMKESSRFAEIIQEEMNTLSGIQGRGVKQAPFRVLMGATMPAALVEVAFISNPQEEAKLKSEEFQNAVAAGLLQAVQRFKGEYEARLGIAPARPSAAPTSAGAPSATSATSATSAAPSGRS